MDRCLMILSVNMFFSIEATCKGILVVIVPVVTIPGP